MTFRTYEDLARTTQEIGKEVIFYTRTRLIGGKIVIEGEIRETGKEDGLAFKASLTESQYEMLGTAMNQSQGARTQ